VHVTAAPGTNRASLLALARWPHHTQLLDHASEGEIGWIIDLVTAIRSVRAEMNLTFATELVLRAGWRVGGNRRARRTMGRRGQAIVATFKILRFPKIRRTVRCNWSCVEKW